MTPLSTLIYHLMICPLEKLATADPEKASRDLGISLDHARGYIQMFQRQRGVAAAPTPGDGATSSKPSS